MNINTLTTELSTNSLFYKEVKKEVVLDLFYDPSMFGMSHQFVNCIGTWEEIDAWIDYKPKEWVAELILKGWSEGKIEHVYQYTHEWIM